MCVVMASGLRVTEAVLLLGKESLLLCEGFTLSPSGDVCCRKHHSSRYTYVWMVVYHHRKKNKHISSTSTQLEQFDILDFFLCQCEGFLHFHHAE